MLLFCVAMVAAGLIRKSRISAPESLPKLKFKPKTERYTREQLTWNHGNITYMTMEERNKYEVEFKSDGSNDPHWSVPYVLTQVIQDTAFTPNIGGTRIS